MLLESSTKAQHWFNKEKCMELMLRLDNIFQLYTYTKVNKEIDESQSYNNI